MKTPLPRLNPQIRNNQGNTVIKNATIFKLAEPLAIGHSDLAQMPFSPTMPTQEKSLGWVPPGSDGIDMAVKNSGATVCQLLVETRKVPAATLAAEVDAQCRHIEDTTGRKPGKKERRNLKEQALTTLLPHAFPSRKSALCILDGDTLIVDSTSAGMLDDVLTALVRCVDGSVAVPLQTNDSPASEMSQWLYADTAPEGFSIGNACELQACDDSKAKVKYTNHYLLTDEVKAHLMQRKIATSLALEFNNRVSFTLTDGLQLKKIDFGEAVMEQAMASAVDKSDFDGSMAIAIGEIRPLIAELVSALGGLVTVAAKEGGAQ